LTTTLNEKKRIAIIGGTGKEGRGLAYRWNKAGYQVIIGSRDSEKAEATVVELQKIVENKNKHLLSGMYNEMAVSNCDIAVLTVPYQYHSEILSSLKPFLSGKFLLDVSVPLVPPKVSIVHVPTDGSAALEAQKILGEEARVISAFQNISFELLLSDSKIECDVLVCGVDAESRELGVKLVEDAGLSAWDAGPLENSIIPEGLTSILIRINKKYGTHSAGIKITGVDR